LQERVEADAGAIDVNNSMLTQLQTAACVFVLLLLAGRSGSSCWRFVTAA
jgi:hypothetical protein